MLSALTLSIRTERCLLSRTAPAARHRALTIPARATAEPTDYELPAFPNVPADYGLRH